MALVEVSKVGWAELSEAQRQITNFRAIIKIQITNLAANQPFLIFNDSIAQPNLQK